MWRAAAEAGAMGHLDELQMHINKLKLRWPYKPKITVPLLVLSVSSICCRTQRPPSDSWLRSPR